MALQKTGYHARPCVICASARPAFLRVSKPDPDSRERYKHFQSISTRWMDNDVYRHVNNVVYYSWFDTVVNQYLVESGALDIEKSPVIGLVVETHCNYFSPLSFPQVVETGLRVARLGVVKRSARLEPVPHPAAVASSPRDRRPLPADRQPPDVVRLAAAAGEERGTRE